MLGADQAPEPRPCDIHAEFGVEGLGFKVQGSGSRLGFRFLPYGLGSGVAFPLYIQEIPSALHDFHLSELHLLTSSMPPCAHYCTCHCLSSVCPNHHHVLRLQGLFSKSPDMKPNTNPEAVWNRFVHALLLEGPSLEGGRKSRSEGGGGGRRQAGRQGGREGGRDGRREGGVFVRCQAPAP